MSRRVLVPFVVGVAVCALVGAGSTVAVASPQVAATVRLSVSSGPPTTVVKVSGSGFVAKVGVDLYFDSTHEAVAWPSPAGSFTAVAVTVPASALPGGHWVSAAQRRGGPAVQQAFLVQTNWPRYRGSLNHAGVNPYENVLSPAVVGGLQPAWSFDTGGMVRSSPTVVNGVVYIGSEHTVGGAEYALNAATGAVLWSFPTGGGVYSTAAVVGGVVYFGTEDGKVYALNAVTGKLRWSFTAVTAQAVVDSSPTVVGGVLYIGEGGTPGHVYALNASTGALLWSFSSSDAVVGAPTVIGGVVYVGGGNAPGHLYALKASTGALLWSYATGDWVWSTPAVVNGIVYFGSLDGSVYALKAATGALVWAQSTGSYVWSSPAVSAGLVYVGNYRGTIYALDAATGAIVWTYQTGGEVHSSPTVADGVVYLGSYDLYLYALDARTGSPLWIYYTGNWVDSGSATVVNGVLYDRSVTNTLTAFTVPNATVAVPRPDPATLTPANSRG